MAASELPTEIRAAVKRWVLSGRLRMPGTLKALPAPREKPMERLVGP